MLTLIFFILSGVTAQEAATRFVNQLEPKLRATLQANGSLERVNQELAQVFADNQTAVTLQDSSSKRDYPYFDHGLIHIKGSGWLICDQKFRFA